MLKFIDVKKKAAQRGDHYRLRKFTGMEFSVVIKSAHDGTALEFFDHAGDGYKVSLRGSNYQGTVCVYDVEPAHLRAFFHDLAAHWRGWQDEKKWGSLEGELTLTAVTDSTGHTSLLVRLRSGPYPYDWSLTTTLLIEAGQLEQIAAQMETFVKHKCDVKPNPQA